MVPVEIQLSDKELQTKAQESLFCTLYADDLVTEIQVMQALSLNRRQFHDLLLKYNVAPLHSEEDLEDALNFTRS